MNTGRVVFSFDFELGWGHRTTRPSYVEHLRSQEQTIRGRIEELIDLFDTYEIPSTWAAVGKLTTDGGDDLFHAPDLFEYLLDSTTEHEIGLHSFGHIPYNQLSPAEARDDLTKGITALEEWGIYPESFVFPQNKIKHLDILQELDMQYYRTVSDSTWADYPSKILCPKTYSDLNDTSAPVGVPSSMFLATRRPSTFREWYALRGVAEAKKEKKMVHYWLHPHNVVTDDNLITEIETLLTRVRSAADQGNIKIQTMRDVAEDLSDNAQSSVENRS